MKYIGIFYFFLFITPFAGAQSDTSRGYVDLKPGRMQIISKSNQTSANSRIIFDTLGLSILKNDSSVIRFTNLQNSNNLNYPLLILDPDTKEVFTREIKASNILPPQDGNNGKFLQTDGKNLSWQFWQNIDVADFSSQYPEDDCSAIQAAVNAAKEGDNIYLEDRTYVLSSGVIISKSLNFIGKTNTIIKRSNEETTPLIAPATNSDTKLVVANPGIFRTGEKIILYNSNTLWGATNTVYVDAISADTLILHNSIGDYTGSANSIFPIGTMVKKAFSLFELVSPGSVPTFTAGFSNITFDGNRDNNNSNVGYHHSWAIGAISKKATVIQNCSFINMPTEAICGHNFKIKNCVFKNLNGSAVHFSISKQLVGESEIFSEIVNNVFQNTNQLSTATITGHSEGVFTTSNSGGYFTASNNRFSNCGEAVIGSIYPSVSIYDYGTNNIIFTDNYIDTAKRLVYLIDDITPGTINGVLINNNHFIHPTEEIDLSPALAFPGRENIVIQGYRSMGQTETLNILAQSGATTGQTIVWNGSGWVPTTLPDSLNRNLTTIQAIENSSDYTLTSNDTGKTLTFNNANEINVLVPAGLAIGFNCNIIQLGEGRIIIQESGATVMNRQGFKKTASKYASIQLVCISNNQFILSGDVGE